MLGKILNLDGVMKLEREQQKSINGGVFEDDLCKFTVNFAGGGSFIGLNTVGGSSDSEINANANSACLHAMDDYPGSTCSYDCAYDGFSVQ